MSDCPWTRDRLGELALGVLDGDERADVLEHIEHCPACRVDAARDAATVDALVHFVPAVTPPPGFSTRTLERMDQERGRVPRRRQWQLLAAAAVLVVATVITSIAVVRILDARPEAGPRPDVTAAAMLGEGGASAGKVFLAGDRYLVATVDYGIADGRYRLEAVSGANVRALGSVRVRGGRGVWAGHAGDVGDIDVVRMLDRAGQTVCQARFALS